MLRYIIIVSCLIFLSACSRLPAQVKTEPTTIPPGQFYFFSQTCPHCAVVKDYIDNNRIQDSFYFISQDVNNDRRAYELFVAVGERCGLNERRLAIPLFWDGSNCYLGEEKVINHFKTFSK